MGYAIEVVSGAVTNPGATLTAVTMNSGDSLAVRSFDATRMARLDNVWALGATAGAIRIRSPRLHDNLQNLRFQVAAADPRPLLSDWIYQRLYPMDQLIVEQSGGAAEVDCFSAMLYYEEIAGFNQRLVRWEEISQRVEHYLTCEVGLTTAATAGLYSNAVALNTTFDNLQAGRDYALLGYNVSAQVATVTVRGADTSNLRVGGPGHLQKDETRDWFLRNDLLHDAPFIPVINAANKGATFVEVTSNATGATVTVDLILALLSTI